jgi:ABC-type transport system substrate-binding protein
VRSTPARRATGVSAALARAATETDATARGAIIGEANTAIRDGAVIVPLAHPGSTVAFRSDVAGVATSPLGLDPLGAATPGDRPQLVFDQASEPAGAWCGDQSSLDAFRLCGLLADGLYGFAPGSLAPEPRLARACRPDDDARVWTCTLPGDLTFNDGTVLDAGDVLASVVAAWDGAGPPRLAAPEGAFATWDALFGGPAGAGG